MPELICTTCRTPGIASARVASKLATVPPKTGQRWTVPTSIPGTLTSMPNTALPVTLSGVSSRGVPLPINLNWSGVFSVGFWGTGSGAALSASSPYPNFLPLGRW